MTFHPVPRDLRPAVKEACGRGWTLRHCKDHSQLLAPDGSGIVTLPSTPSDHRGIRNAKAYLKQMGGIG